MLMISFLPLPLLLVACSSAFQITTTQRERRTAVNTKLNSYTLQSTIDIKENAPRDIATVYDWAANYGIQTIPGFELSTQDGYDYYATTSQEIPAETPIVYVPNELILTGNKARLEFGTEVSAAERSLKLSDHGSFYLFLKILKEYALGSDSYWYSWLNSLPRYFSTGSAMTQFCFSCLPPYAAKQTQQEKSKLKRFELALDEITFLSEETKSNEELLLWAYNVVHTRYHENSFGDYCLLPMADYFNHYGDTNDVYITFDADGNCYANSLQDVRAGQPLRMCLCDPTNPSQTLAKFGFLDESSPTTYCKWIAEDPSSEIAQMGYPSKMLFDNNGGISTEVWDVILYTELGKVSLEQQQAFFQAFIQGDEQTKSNYHNQYFPQTLAALQQHVDYILNELDELSVWQVTKLDTGNHPRLPLIMKHNDFVKNTFSLVQQSLRNMSS